MVSQRKSLCLLLLAQILVACASPPAPTQDLATASPEQQADASTQTSQPPRSERQQTVTEWPATPTATVEPTRAPKAGPEAATTPQPPTATLELKKTPAPTFIGRTTAQPVTPLATGKTTQTPRPSLQQATPSQPATPVVTSSVVKAPKPQQPAASDLPSQAESGQDPLVQGANAFAFDLYQELRGGQRNLFYSPYSISLAAAMAYAGARAETEAQMASTLHFALPQKRLHPVLGALNRDLIARGKETGGFGDSFRLSVANALWGQQGYPFLPEFLDTLDQHYGSAPGRLDFANAPEESRHTINDWVADHTEGRIQDLLPPGAIRSATRLVLANAIYFDASWFYPFDPDATAKRTFYLLDGTTVTVPMMRQTEGHAYVLGQGY